MIDEYQTIAAATVGEFKDKGSKFIAYAYPIQSEEEVGTYLKQLKKEHLKARHHCYAYRLGVDKNNFRANDDGEPSGTAGKPILGQIDSFQVTNVLIVVVRYFGGTKLGTSGLINAYKTSAALALQSASILKKEICDVYKLAFDYAIMGDVMRVVKKVGLTISHQSFETHPYLEVQIKKSEVANKLLALKAGITKVSLEEAALLESIPHLTLTYLQTV